MYYVDYLTCRCCQTKRREIFMTSEERRVSAKATWEEGTHFQGRFKLDTGVVMFFL